MNRPGAGVVQRPERRTMRVSVHPPKATSNTADLALIRRVLGLAPDAPVVFHTCGRRP